jgi:hypothetical protein
VSAVSNDVPVESLTGSWTHSFEEDSEGLMVFRPSGSTFPRSRRGRLTIELGSGGDLQHLAPGPDDRRVRALGGWGVEGRSLTLSVPGQADQRFAIQSVEKDRLVVRKES